MEENPYCFQTLTWNVDASIILLNTNVIFWFIYLPSFLDHETGQSDFTVFESSWHLCLTLESGGIS